MLDYPEHIKWYNALPEDTKQVLSYWADLDAPDHQGQAQYTVTETARCLGLSPMTVRHHIKTGAIKAMQQGRKHFILANEVVRELYDRTHQAKAAPLIPMGWVFASQQGRHYGAVVVSRAEMERFRSKDDLKQFFPELKEEADVEYDVVPVMYEDRLDMLGILKTAKRPYKVSHTISSQGYRLTMEQQRIFDLLSRDKWYLMGESEFVDLCEVLASRQPEMTLFRLVRLALELNARLHDTPERVAEMDRALYQANL